MMPHLGVFSTVNPQAATEIFLRDCLIELGTVIAPQGDYSTGRAVLELESDNLPRTILRGGEIIKLDLAVGTEASAVIKPLSSTIDVGAGPGKARQCTLRGGHAGIILDGRGRPIKFSLSEKEQHQAARRWHQALGLLF